MESRDGLQEVLDHLSDEINNIEVLREAAVAFRGPFPEFLRKLHQAARQRKAPLGTAFNSALRELRHDIGIAVSDEVRLQTFSRENFEGMCRHVGIILVLKIVNTQKEKVRRAHSARPKSSSRPKSSDADLKRMRGGPRQKAAEAYERVKTPARSGIRMVV